MYLSHIHPHRVPLLFCSSRPTPHLLLSLESLPLLESHLCVSISTHFSQQIPKTGEPNRTIAAGAHRTLSSPPKIQTANRCRFGVEHTRIRSSTPLNWAGHSLSTRLSRKMPSSKDDSATNTGSSSYDIPESNSVVYSVGEKVFAYHGPHCYDAKVQRAELRNKEWRYFVHYTGWSKNWDEWVGADRLVKLTQESAKKQDKKHSVQKSARSGSSAQDKPKKSTDLRVDKEDTKCHVAKGKKHKADSGTEDSTPVEKLITIQIPSTLNKQLVHDWEFITQQNKLVQLPRSPNVDDILRKYLEYRTEKDGMMTDADGEILNGVRCYFDKSLPVMLLYQKERQQYREAVSGNVSPSSVYGAEHLLRLFVKLPELLACLKIEDETLIQLQQKLVDFLNLNFADFCRRIRVHSFLLLMTPLKLLV